MIANLIIKQETALSVLLRIGGDCGLPPATVRTHLAEPRKTREPL
jgi:hypothetical protein